MSRCVVGAVLLVGALVAFGCTTPTRPYREPPPPGFKPTEIDYADTDAFDAYFETALTQEDPVVVIRTGRSKPDWDDRLNEWLAAWNQGGRVREPKRKARGALPLSPVVVDGDSIREFRLLVNGLMDRVDERARVRSAWYAEEQTRARRIALLVPYNLRFHADEMRTIQLIFFNGNYKEMYSGYMEAMAKADTDGPAEWQRDISCSWCKGEQ